MILFGIDIFTLGISTTQQKIRNYDLGQYFPFSLRNRLSVKRS